MKKFYKNGEYLVLDGMLYLVLGYSDYKRKYIVLADLHGNKHNRLIN